MADRAAWALGVSTAREHYLANAGNGPWMSPASHAAQAAVIEAGYPPLTSFERRAILTVVLGEAHGDDREAIKERIHKMRDAKARRSGRTRV